MELQLNNFCRMCLENNCPVMHHIFNEGLNNKIIILSGIDIQVNDALPKQICRDCRYQLEKSYYFRMVAKHSDTRLRKHIRLINNNKPSSLLDKDHHDDDTEEYEEIYLESFKYFESAKKEVDNLRKEFETEKENLMLKEVEKRLKEGTKHDKSVLRQSVRIGSPNKALPGKPVLLNKLASTNQRFESSPTVRRKQKQEESSLNEIVLGNFEIQFLNPTGYVDEIEHVYQVEGVTENTEVEIIDEAQVPEENEEFEEIAESEEEYKPPAPKKRLSLVKKANTRRKQILVTKPEKKEASPLVKDSANEFVEDHYFEAIENVDDQDLDENGEKKIFQCAFENCVRRFARRQACKTHFYNHLASQAVPNGYKCKSCQKTFKVLSALERHVRVHTGDKPFKCGIDGCSKAFSQREMLKRHKIIHLAIEDAPFACTKCDKKFRQKEPLRLHINKAHSTNTESLSYKCSICNKNFAHSSGLSRHFLIHSGRLFSCEICGKAFNDKSAMKRHSNIHK